MAPFLTFDPKGYIRVLPGESYLHYAFGTEPSPAVSEGH